MTKLNSDHYWEHERAGGGWIVVEQLPKGDVRIAAPSPKGKFDQAFLAWEKMLKPERRFKDPKNPDLGTYVPKISEELLLLVRQLRSDIAGGIKRVVSSHIV